MALGQSNLDEKAAKLRHRKSQKSSELVWQCIAILEVGRGSVADGVIEVSYQPLTGSRPLSTSPSGGCERIWSTGYFGRQQLIFGEIGASATDLVWSLKTRVLDAVFTCLESGKSP
jgi:hypothetical protein